MEMFAFNDLGLGWLFVAWLKWRIV